MGRRTVLTLLPAAVAAVGCSAPGGAQGPTATPTTPAPTTPAPTPSPSVTREVPGLPDLERETGVRIGLYAVDTATGEAVEHRPDERFAFASTAKALSAALVLAATTDEQLDAPVPVVASDVVSHSPVIATRVGTGTTLREAAEAAVTVSDNTAQNLLLDALGGPAGFGEALRGIGDTTTDPQRYETELNDVVPQGPGTADTSTPRALATSLRAVAVDGVLSPGDRTRLVGWLRASTTGASTIRAGTPEDWLVGDKTGTGNGYGIRNDIAVLWPGNRPDAAPVVLAVLTDTADPAAEPRDDVIARATAIALTALTTTTVIKDS